MSEEERIIEEQIDEVGVIETEETFVPIVDETIKSAVESEIITVDVNIPETMSLTVSESAGSTALNIVADHSPYLPDQHTISAITGLREELDEIERLKTVYSDGKNQANYYMWEDENPNQENRDGYFVSIHQNDNKIRICKSDEDEFGVTVSGAGFIGNQNEEILKGNNYGLVVNSGLVSVRCETDVVAGDYVVSDDYGVAKKTDGTYGYLVAAISKVDSVGYAIISLTVPTTQMQKFSETAQDVADRMDSAEINIATAISVANAAYNKAKISQEWVQGNVENIAGEVVIIGGKVDSVVGDMGELSESITNADIQAKEAYDIAHQAQAKAETIRAEAVKIANAAQASINDLIVDVGPITTWTNEDGDMGAEYFVEHMNNNLATKTEVLTVEKLTENNLTAISKNAEQIELLATSVDKYSVGEFSQAYGLTWEQAKSILKKDMLYIPTVEHDEYYDEYPTDDNKHEFTRGYYYTWNGSYWVESQSSFVYFSNAYVLPSAKCKYWYRETNEDLKHIDSVTGDVILYEANSLYTLIDNKWIKVNILDGNVTNRIVSAIRQTSNQISIDVTNARGDIAALEAKVDAGGAATAMMASVVTQFKDSSGNPIDITGSPYASKDDISAIDGNYYAVGKSAPYDIYTLVDGELTKITYLYYDGVNIKQPNTASIIAAVNNEGDSSIVLNANKLNFNGYATFTDDGSGITGISGSLIHTGTIASNDGTIKIDLGNNTAAISGRITATSGYIGNEDNGFFICCVGLRHIATKALSAKTYYFTYNSKYYSFTTNETIPTGSTIIVSFEENKMYTSNGITSNVTVGDTKPSGTLLSSEYTSYYSLSNKQWSYSGDGSGSAGVYIGPDGIGLGNGKFIVNSNGDISAKSGYIGDEADGFSIKRDTTYLSYTVKAERLSKGKYYFKYSDDCYYQFETSAEVDEQAVIMLFPDDLTIAINGQFQDSTASKSSSRPSNYTSLDATEKSYYTLSNNQSQYIGEKSKSNKEGVYIGPDGIGLGNGKFYVNSNGDLNATGATLTAGSINGALVLGGQILGAVLHGGSFYGGTINVTGQGRENGSALYIYNDNILKGYISYDDQGAGSIEETKERMFITTSANTALKLKANSANMSLEADTVWITNAVKIENGTTSSSSTNYGKVSATDVVTITGGTTYASGKTQGNVKIDGEATIGGKVKIDGDVEIDGLAYILYDNDGDGTKEKYELVTKFYVSNNYATKTWVTNKNYLTTSDLSGYATQSWVNNKNYLTTSDLSGYATTSNVANCIKSYYDDNMFYADYSKEQKLILIRDTSGATVGTIYLS